MKLEPLWKKGALFWPCSTMPMGCSQGEKGRSLGGCSICSICNIKSSSTWMAGQVEEVMERVTTTENMLEQGQENPKEEEKKRKMLEMW